MYKNGLDKRVVVVTVATTVLFGAFAMPSVYAKVLKFETPFESSLIPACSSEEVFFTGVAAFTFQETTDKDGNVRQTVHMNYQKTRGEISGTEYIVHEHDTFVTHLDASTSKFSTVIKGSFIAKGSETNTHHDQTRDFN